MCWALEEGGPPGRVLGTAAVSGGSGSKVRLRA